MGISIYPDPNAGNVSNINANIGTPSDTASATGSTLFSRVNFLVNALNVPVVVTNAVTGTTGGFAYTTLNGAFTPPPVLGGVTAYGFVYGTSVNPTLSGTVITLGTSLTFGSNFSAFVGNVLSANTVYHYRAYMTTSGVTYYGYDMSFTTASTAVGSQDPIPGGGVVIYDKGSVSSNNGETAWRYLVAASSDLNSGSAISGGWAYNANTQSNTGFNTDYTSTYAAIGWGEKNTNTIYTANSNSTSGTTAIYLAKNYNGGGYTDWFLPSEQELVTLYGQKSLSGLGSFQSANYWASTEYSATYAQFVSFSNGSTTTNVKTAIAYYARAIRAF